MNKEKTLDELIKEHSMLCQEIIKRGKLTNRRHLRLKSLEDKISRVMRQSVKTG